MKINQNLLTDKTILITGGTGSFGNTMVQELITNHQPREIIIYSRDEKKQYDMRNHYNQPNIRYIIGDTRDPKPLKKVMKNTDIVFHAAALKQVPTCEFFPLEAVKTNILGSSNVMDAAEEAGVEKVVILSTDKAVYPINAMGMTKALMEKTMTAKARNNNSDTTYCGVRYGNVMFSRGSVLPLFKKQIQNNEADLVIGSRYVEGSETDAQTYRKLGLGVINEFGKSANETVQDSQIGFTYSIIRIIFSA